MTFIKSGATIAALALLASCGNVADKTVDRQFGGSKPLTQLKAGIWVDPDGCDHWIIDDGAEGYLSDRLDKYGKPVCSGIAPPTMAIGDFKKGGDIPDFL